MTASERIRQARALAEMSEAEIRRCQDLVRQQQGMAYKQHNLVALERLNEYENGYANEMMRRLDAR
jgi:hypothetical protein